MVAAGRAGRGGTLGVEAGAERRAADEQRDRDDDEQRELRPAHPRLDAEPARRVRLRERRSLAAPVEPEPDLADLQLVAEPERCHAARPARR